VHIVRVRSVHSWVFVGAQALVLLGALLHSLWLMYASAAVLGVAFAGGALAWNLGHLDFAPAHKASQYMGVHVTLNGVRGLLAPLAAVAIYDALDAAAAGQWVFGISVVLCIVGAMGFVLQRRVMGAAAERRPEERAHTPAPNGERQPEDQSVAPGNRLGV
jgi:MFS family permease